jgi:2-C-methyl-D-erythritol 2,4-cyclodiphosphate synthase
MRIGHGYDAHQFEQGRKLVLCGVEIESDLGLKAHSDGDVAIHALCDALLGAAALGDIGKHFPDNSDDFKNIDSRILLRNIVEQLHSKQYNVHNADITIVAQTPRLAGYINQMKSVMSEDMQISPDAVNVKATTTEHMGFVGRREGIASYAVVLLNETI